jgi:hypothetical protein
MMLHSIIVIHAAAKEIDRFEEVGIPKEHTILLQDYSCTQLHLQTAEILSG